MHRHMLCALLEEDRHAWFDVYQDFFVNTQFMVLCERDNHSLLRRIIYVTDEECKQEIWRCYSG